ncbi:MAG: class I SAM-dependent methyltransferase [Chitinispirillaceae bacterium]|nr:class I SAM-dependent methyltransferase [Chitinispirillaceae bacterium]
MAHKAQNEILKSLKKQYKPFFVKSKVLEIGSYNINGTIRKLFSRCDYTGIDVAPGKCVDIVCPGEKFDAPDNSFDLCISSECFEHNPMWVETFRNMIRMTRPGGLIIVTCATTGRAEHGTVNAGELESLTTRIEEWKSYYKNLTEEDFRREFDFQSVFETHTFLVNSIACDLYFYGIKK